jgi:hypothetical protein
VTVWETIGVFVGIPAGIVILIALAVFGPTSLRQQSRYRPGKPWDYPPSWYVPHPEVLAAAPDAGSSTTAVGGASGEW